MRELAIVASVLLASCASIPVEQPREAVCRACAILQQTGVCERPDVLGPECPEGEELYVANFDEVLAGAEPDLECREAE